MMEALKLGQRLRLRLAGRTDDWTDVVVILASAGNPQSVGVQVRGMVRAGHGSLIGIGLALFVDYEQEKVMSLLGDEYEIEVAGEDK